MIRLLLVDDEPSLRRMLRLAFKSANFEVFEAESGTAALVQFHRHQPDVVLLDIELPDGSGIDICRQMRAGTSPNSASVGIILMSGHFRHGHVPTLEGVGADHLVGKPFRIQSLRELVGALHVAQGRSSISATRRASSALR